MWKESFGTLWALGTDDGPLLRGLQGLVGGAAIVLIRGYQFIISPFLPGSCRFTPSCSHYAIEAFRRHAPHKAFWLSLRRVARCHPLHPGGEDPVP